MLNRAIEQRPAVTRTETFPAPTAGWVQSGNITNAQPIQAEVLDNFIPTAQGARLRGGISELVDVGASVLRLFSYASGASETLFAATASTIQDTANAFASVEDLGGGDWSVTQISTSGGQFLVGVNGVDLLHYFNDSEWNPVNAAAVNDVPFDTQTGAFSVGETVTGGTSGATATILSVTKTSATAGVLKVGAITSGPFQDNEALTDAATGAADASAASGAAPVLTITNVATSALSQVWLFKRRLFFVEKGTTSAWYLPVDSIGGAATEIDLGANFQLGGNLLFGATWSLDSGSGLDDVCLFVSDQGEVAVYEGTDPDSASTWSLVGVYRIGQPLNKHAFFQAGGDLAILTDDGIVPISEALRKDRAALQAVAITFPIEDAWKDAIANRTTSFPITATLWQSGTLLLVGTPATAGGSPASFVANARTGAWARITGWDVRCSAVFDDKLYFGTSTGKVYQADTGSTDDGVGYVGKYVPKFQDSDRRQSAVAANITYRANTEANVNLYAHSDYEVDDMQSPPATNYTADGAWGTGVWGTFVWGAGLELDTYSEWQFVRTVGYSMTPGLTILVNQTTPIIFEILATRLRIEGGYAL